MFCQPRSQEKGGEKGASTPSPPPPLLSMVKQSIADGRYGLEDCRAVVVSGGHPPKVTCFRVCVPARFRMYNGIPNDTARISPDTDSDTGVLDGLHHHDPVGGK